MTRKNRVKTNAIPAPKTRSDAERLLAEIGDHQRELSDLEIQMNQEIEEIKEHFNKHAKPLNEKIEQKFEGLHVWAEAHRDELCQGGRKSVELATGRIAWRLTPKKVSLSNTAKVLESLKKLGLSRFIRTKEEVDKDAVLADPDAVEGIKGISLSQREEFAAVPAETEIERVTTKKAKK